MACIEMTKEEVLKLFDPPKTNEDRTCLPVIKELIPESGITFNTGDISSIVEKGYSSWLFHSIHDIPKDLEMKYYTYTTNLSTASNDDSKLLDTDIASSSWSTIATYNPSTNWEYVVYEDPFAYSDVDPKQSIAINGDNKNDLYFNKKTGVTDRLLAKASFVTVDDDIFVELEIELLKSKHRVKISNDLFIKSMLIAQVKDIHPLYCSEINSLLIKNYIELTESVFQDNTNIRVSDFYRCMVVSVDLETQSAEIIAVFEDMRFALQQRKLYLFRPQYNIIDTLPPMNMIVNNDCPVLFLNFYNKDNKLIHTLLSRYNKDYYFPNDDMEDTFIIGYSATNFDGEPIENFDELKQNIDHLCESWKSGSDNENYNIEKLTLSSVREQKDHKEVVDIDSGHSDSDEIQQLKDKVEQLEEEKRNINIDDKNNKIENNRKNEDEPIDTSFYSFI